MPCAASSPPRSKRRPHAALDKGHHPLALAEGSGQRDVGAGWRLPRRTCAESLPFSQDSPQRSRRRRSVAWPTRPGSGPGGRWARDQHTHRRGHPASEPLTWPPLRAHLGGRARFAGWLPSSLGSRSGHRSCRSRHHCCCRRRRRRRAQRLALYRYTRRAPGLWARAQWRPGRRSPKSTSGCGGVARPRRGPAR